LFIEISVTGKGYVVIHFFIYTQNNEFYLRDGALSVLQWDGDLSLLQKLPWVDSELSVLYE